MGRPRTKDLHLPKRVYERRGMYYYVRPSGEWVPLGSSAENTWKQVALLAPVVKESPQTVRHLGRVYSRAKERAKRRGKLFQLEYADMMTLWKRSKGRCEVTGIPFRLDNEQGFKRRPYAPSLDRISAKDCYSLGNCRLVCTAVNIAINEWGLEHFRVIARALKGRGLFNIEQKAVFLNTGNAGIKQ